MNQFALYHTEEAEKAYKEHYTTQEVPYALFSQGVEVRQLGAMQAWIITDRFCNRWLQSYNTIVSVCWVDTHEVQRLGHWSVSTSKQQTRFEKEV